MNSQVSAEILQFPYQRPRPEFLYGFDLRPFKKPVQILYLPPPVRFEQLAENLWLMRLEDTPGARAQADRIVAELRANNMTVPDYMKENCDA